MLDIKEYLKQTRTVLVTQDAFDELVKKVSVQRTGKWIDSHGHTTIDGHDMSELFIRCSECGHDYPDLKDMRFCPNCGAKMEGEK